MSSTLQHVSINEENRQLPTVGVAFGSDRYAPAQAQAMSERAERLQREYGKDSVLKINGQTVDPLVGAAAVHNAYMRRFGHAPVVRPFGPYGATEKSFTLQEFRFMLRTGDTVLEHELNSHRVWPAEAISEYLETHHPEIEQPRYVKDSDRDRLAKLMRSTLPIVGAPTRTINVPWGAAEYPADPDRNIEAGDIWVICTEADGSEYGSRRNVARFVIVSTLQFKTEVDEFYDLVLSEVPKVYANRYLVIGSQGTGNVSFLDPYTRVNRREVVHTQEMTEELDIRIRGPLRYTEQARRIDPRMLNRKSLFVGEAGTGKTMTTLLLGQEALENGWTIIQCQPGDEHQFAEIMRFAAMHEKVICIIEDLEKMMPDTEGLTSQQRLAARSKLLDMFDGGEIKGKEIQFWLTSNYPNLWISAMARPGRVDAYFEFQPLDRPGFEKLIRVKLGTRLGDVDFDEIWNEIGGMSSSFLAAVADYAREGLLGKEDGHLLVTADIKPIIRGLKRQYEWYEHLKAQETAAREQSVSEWSDTWVGQTLGRELDKRGMAVAK